MNGSGNSQSCRWAGTRSTLPLACHTYLLVHFFQEEGVRSARQRKMQIAG